MCVRACVYNVALRTQIVDLHRLYISRCFFLALIMSFFHTQGRSSLCYLYQHDSRQDTYLYLEASGRRRVNFQSGVTGRFSGWHGHWDHVVINGRMGFELWFRYKWPSDFLHIVHLVHVGDAEYHGLRHPVRISSSYPPPPRATTSFAVSSSRVQGRDVHALQYRLRGNRQPDCGQ